MCCNSVCLAYCARVGGAGNAMCSDGHVSVSQISTIECIKVGEQIPESQLQLLSATLVTPQSMDPTKGTNEQASPSSSSSSIKPHQSLHTRLIDCGPSLLNRPQVLSTISSTSRLHSTSHCSARQYRRQLGSDHASEVPQDLLKKPGFPGRCSNVPRVSHQTCDKNLASAKTTYWMDEVHHVRSDHAVARIPLARNQLKRTMSVTIKGCT